MVRGIGQDIVDRLAAEGGSFGHVRAPGTHVYTWTPSYPEVLKYVAARGMNAFHETPPHRTLPDRVRVAVPRSRA